MWRILPFVAFDECVPQPESPAKNAVAFLRYRVSRETRSSPARRRPKVIISLSVFSELGIALDPLINAVTGNLKVSSHFSYRVSLFSDLFDGFNLEFSV